MNTIKQVKDSADRLYDCLQKSRDNVLYSLGIMQSLNMKDDCNFEVKMLEEIKDDLLNIMNKLNGTH